MRPAAIALALGACHHAAPPAPDVDAPPAPDASLACRTMHTGPITAAETWRAADGPHCVAEDLAIGAPVTIEAGASVELAYTVGITIGAGGALDAQGTPAAHVTIASAGAGQWGTIAVSGGALSLAYTDLREGGFPPTLSQYAAMIDASTPLHVDHVTLEDPAVAGLYLHDGGAFDGTSAALSVPSGMGYPLIVSPAALATIPADASFSGASAGILIDTGHGAILDRDAHVRSLGARYSSSTVDPSDPGFGRMLPLVVVGATGVATLTIDAGVTIDSGGILVDPDRAADRPARAALIAQGSADQPVILNGPEVTLGGMIDPTTRIDYAQLDPGVNAPPAPTVATGSCPYPGQPAINGAELRLLGPPASAFVTNSQIISFTHGIDRGYRSDTKLDLTPTNVFVLSSPAACEETYPADADGACPASPPCTH